ncbi:MAG: GNAT family N-acetyltransferase [Paracoccaceae bacterium]
MPSGIVAGTAAGIASAGIGAIPRRRGQSCCLARPRPPTYRKPMSAPPRNAPDGSPVVRSGEPRDAAAIAEMANALAVLTMGRPGPMTAETVVSDLLEAPGLFCMVAENPGTSGAVAGYALYTAAYETAFAARGLYLTDLYVQPSVRRQGLATALIAALAARAAAEGGIFLWWVTNPTNAEAMRVYDRLGAIRDPVVARAIYGPPFDRLLG